MITEHYRELNRRLHESNAHYGTSGKRYVKPVRELMRVFGAETILDYGCGKRTLEEGLGFPIANYDPCVAGLDAPPEPADLVVCTDVLEHIEPECLDNVLDDLRRVTKTAAFLTIATKPAKKFLEDGRNAHLIQKDGHWWLEQIMPRFRVKNIQMVGGEVIMIVKPHAT